MPSRANCFGLEFDEKSLNTWLLVALLVIVVYQFFFNKVQSVSGFGFDFGASVYIVNSAPSKYALFKGTTALVAGSKQLVVGDVLTVKDKTAGYAVVATGTISALAAAPPGNTGPVSFVRRITVDTGGQLQVQNVTLS